MFSCWEMPGWCFCFSVAVLRHWICCMLYVPAQRKDCLWKLFFQAVSYCKSLLLPNNLSWFWIQSSVSLERKASSVFWFFFSPSSCVISVFFECSETLYFVFTLLSVLTVAVMHVFLVKMHELWKEMKFQLSELLWMTALCGIGFQCRDQHVSVNPKLFLQLGNEPKSS